MHPAGACLVGCLAMVAAVAAAPATAASTLDINVDPETSTALAHLGGVGGIAMPFHLWGPGDGTTGAGAFEGPSNRSPGHIYVVTDGTQQQSALRGSVSGVNVSTIHTLSFAWDTGQPAGLAPSQVFWGFAFHDRTYKPLPGGKATTVFAPWRQQRFVQDWSAGSRVLPFAEAPPMNGIPDTPPEMSEDLRGAAETARVISATVGIVPDWPTIIVLGALIGMFGLLWWFWARVIRPIRAITQVAPRWPVTARSGSARVLSPRVLAERRGLVSDHLLEDLTPDW